MTDSASCFTWQWPVNQWLENQETLMNANALFKLLVLGGASLGLVNACASAGDQRSDPSSNGATYKKLPDGGMEKVERDPGTGVPGW